MSALGDRIKKARKAADRRECTFELDDEQVTLYSKPLTGRDFDRIARMYPDFVTNPSVASQVHMITMKAETLEGELAFDGKDKDILLGQSLDWIMDIRKKLFSDDEDFSESRIGDDEKN